MIYWKGNRMSNLLYDAAVIQAKYLDYTPSWHNEFARSKSFVEEMGLVFNSSIGIIDDFNYINFLGWNKRHGFAGKAGKNLLFPSFRESIPIVSELSNDFPNRFAIRTRNIDLLRNLIAQGKKVSWLEPDLYTQANYLGILNFEHVFLDPYINTHIIYPSGEIVEAKEAVHKDIYGWWKIKHSKMIGFNLKDVHDRINWKVYNRVRKMRGLSSSAGGFISEPVVVNLYNVFSLTYLIWNQSRLDAMTAKKRTVLTG